MIRVFLHISIDCHAHARKRMHMFIDRTKFAFLHTRTMSASTSVVLDICWYYRLLNIPSHSCLRCRCIYKEYKQRDRHEHWPLRTLSRQGARHQNARIFFYSFSLVLLNSMQCMYVCVHVLLHSCCPCVRVLPSIVVDSYTVYTHAHAIAGLLLSSYSYFVYTLTQLHSYPYACL